MRKRTRANRRKIANVIAKLNVMRRTSDSMSESDRTSKQHTHTRVNRVEERDKERDKVIVEEQARTHKREVDIERDR